ncbi:hypothetical protein K474DRAFT_1770317 [Panus rudis PR-1116 ss-1]|nr:hypothetical protein K474DRAFT_1770317 [Panus rudis PR-1116 ss-1]
MAPSSLDYELQSLRDQISVPETEDSWEKIQKSINKLTTLIQNQGADYPSEFAQFLRSISRPLNSATTTERTRLSAAAIELFKASAEALGQTFSGLLPLFLPTLLSLCSRPNKVFITRAKGCIMHIIEYTQAPVILSYLVDLAKDKSNSLRLSVAECALACLNTFNPPDLEKEARAREVETLIRTTATDATAEVRKVSRKLFEAYKILLPHRVDGFTGPLTPTVRKYLDIKHKAPSANNSNPPSRPTSSLSTHSTSSLNYITRPKSTVPPAPSGAQPLTRSATARVIDSQRHARSNSATSSNSGPSLSKSESLPASRFPVASSAQSKADLVGPSRPVQKGPSRPIDPRSMGPPTSVPLRPHISPPTSSTTDSFPQRPDPAMLPTKSTGGPLRPTAGPSRVPQEDSSAPPQKPRVMGGARRVLLPTPPPVPEPAQPKTESKAPVRPGAPSRAGSVEPQKSTAKPSNSAQSAHTSSRTTTATTAATRKAEPSKKVGSSSSSTTTTSSRHTSAATTKKPLDPSSHPNVTTSRRVVSSSSRLTEPTQAQLARAKATSKPTTAKRSETVKPVPGVRTTTASGNTTARQVTSRKPGIPPRVPRAKTPAPPAIPSEEPKGVKPVPEAVVAVAVKVPLPPSPTLSPTPSVGEVEIETETETEPEVETESMKVQIEEVEVSAESEPEQEEVEAKKDIEAPGQEEGDQGALESTDVPPRSPTPHAEDPRSSTPTQPAENVLNIGHEELNFDGGEEEDEEDDTITQEEALEHVADLPNFTFSNIDPSTPLASTRRNKRQIVPETPISALLVSIQRGFDLSPNSLDPDQTATFGGLIPAEGGSRCEPLFVERKRPGMHA